MAKFKFHSPLFPNLELIGNGMRIQFKDSFYETEDTKEVELLKSSGFVAVPVQSAPLEKKKAASKEDK
jgi:hypothetical protein